MHCILKNYSTRIVFISIKVGYACIVYTCVFVFEHYKLFLHSVSQFILVAFVMEKEEQLNKLEPKWTCISFVCVAYTIDVGDVA